MKIGVAGLDRLRRLGVYAFAEKVADRHGVPAEDVFSLRRTQDVVRARFEVIAVTKDTLGLSAAQMGRLFGTDHTAILHAVRRYREGML